MPHPLERNFEMNVAKTLSIALLIAAASTVARAEQPVDQYGRASKPAGISGTVAPSTGDTVAVAEVQGRSSAMRGTAAKQSAQIVLTNRSVDSYGRS
jgi:hypothetical protein